MPVPAPHRTGCISFCLMLVFAAGAEAHHPGSHARRLPDGRVQLELAAAAADACTTIGDVRPGVPGGLSAPAGSTAYTVQLHRQEDAVCASVVTALRRETAIEVPKTSSGIHLYILTPSGIVQATERVPIR